MYTSGPLTKAEMLRRFKEGRTVPEEFAKKFQIKRLGKDLDDIYWAYGKIHGLENIIYLDEDTLNAVRGNPWELQVAINKVNDMEKPLPPQNFDLLLQKVDEKMGRYKESLESSPKEF